MTPARFPFAFDPGPEKLLRLLGITPDRAWVEVGDRWLDVRYGPWSLRTAVDNVVGAEVSGPYSAPKVIGPHLSLADRGVSFGTNSTEGLCLRFRTPVRAIDPLGLIRHPGCTVTVADVEGLAAALGHPKAPA